MALSKGKEDELLARMEKLGIKEEDLIEKFILGSGSGGQKINKTSSCVYLKHLPTGIEIKCQKDRSRAMNRFLARRDLCEKVESQFSEEKTKKQMAVEKIRRQKRRRSKKAKEKMLANKQKHSEKKTLRGRPNDT
jgi:protein subunit release factor B